MAGKRKTEAVPKPRKRSRKAAAEPGSRGLSPAEVAPGPPSPPEISELAQEVEQDGGRPLGAYRDPLGGHWLLLCVLPLEKVEPTPFQRDLSDAHVERLTRVIGKVGRFLDPILVVHEGDRYWTPNGHHRLAALRRLGARAVTALLIPDRRVAYQILALNTEKAHNLRERSLEVVRIAREVAAREPARTERDLELELEEPALLTIGLCYEGRPRFSGGAYHPIVRRVEAFLEEPLGQALTAREKRSQALLALDDVVAEKVEALRERGLKSPYLRNFVLARLNPLRFSRSQKLGFEELLDRMRAAAAKFDPGKVRPQDLAGAGGPPEEAAG